MPPSNATVLIVVHPDERSYFDFCDRFQTDERTSFLGRPFGKSEARPQPPGSSPEFHNTNGSFQYQHFWNTVATFGERNYILASYVLGQDRIFETTLEKSETPTGAFLLTSPSESLVEATLVRHRLSTELSPTVRGALPVTLPDLLSALV